MMFNCEIIEKFNTKNYLPCVREYTHSNIPHRQYGAARMRWDDSGQSRIEQWCIHGRFHRVEGPAYMVWHDNGNPYWEEWYINDELHRTTGPARIEWYDDGTIQFEDYRLFGNKITDKHQKWAKSVGISNIMCMTPEHLTLFKLTWG